jgi:hypothetical protein
VCLCIGERIYVEELELTRSSNVHLRRLIASANVALVVLGGKKGGEQRGDTRTNKMLCCP